LFGQKKKTGAIPMFSLQVAPLPTHPPKDALEIRVVDLLSAIDMTPTEIQRERDGMTVTVGAIEVALGAAEDLDNKVAFLAALRRSGQHFSYVDLRHVDAPMYR
jgi:chlorophyllide a reductase subunit X